MICLARSVIRCTARQPKSFTFSRMAKGAARVGSLGLVPGIGSGDGEAARFR